MTMQATAMKLLLLVLIAALPSVSRAQTVTYLHTDALGTPIAHTNAAGSVIETSEYSPYGDLLNRQEDDRPGYTGHVVDAATGLTYMQQRYYSPDMGIFLSVDPVGVSPVNGLNFNRYWYASNNPYNTTDPDGRCDGPSTCAIDRDIAAMNRGEMSREDFMERSAARAAGAVTGLIVIAGARSLSLIPAVRTMIVRHEVNKRPDGVPANWKHTPSKDGKGSTWSNPKNAHDSVRTSTGSPRSSQPGQREPYVVRQVDGKRHDANGAVAPKQSKESHIPLKEYKHRSAEELRGINK